MKKNGGLTENWLALYISIIANKTSNKALQAVGFITPQNRKTKSKNRALG